jgi:hypothetical protein
MHLRAYHQFLRVRRYLKKVRLIAEHRFPEGVDDHIEDEVYAFFLNCHHLKDWVLSDSDHLGIKKEAITKFAHSTPCLTICADLADAQKHHGLSATRRSKKNPLPARTPDFIYPIRVMINQRVKPAMLGLDTKVQSDHGELDYLALAESCFDAWTQFLRDQKVPAAFFDE